MSEFTKINRPLEFIPKEGEEQAPIVGMQVALKSDLTTLKNNYPNKLVWVVEIEKLFVLGKNLSGEEESHWKPYESDFSLDVWNQNKKYVEGELVVYDGEVYFAKIENKNEIPEDNDKWKCISNQKLVPVVINGKDLTFGKYKNGDTIPAKETINERFADAFKSKDIIDFKLPEIDKQIDDVIYIDSIENQYNYVVNKQEFLDNSQYIANHGGVVNTSKVIVDGIEVDNLKTIHDDAVITVEYAYDAGEDMVDNIGETQTNPIQPGSVSVEYKVIFKNQLRHKPLDDTTHHKQKPNNDLTNSIIINFDEEFEMNGGMEWFWLPNTVVNKGFDVVRCQLKETLWFSVLHTFSVDPMIYNGIEGKLYYRLLDVDYALGKSKFKLTLNQ